MASLLLSACQGGASTGESEESRQAAGVCSAQWTSPATLPSGDGDAGLPTVTAGPNATTVAAWYQAAGALDVSAEAASLAADGSWSPVATLGSASVTPDPNNRPGFISVAVAADGTSAAAFSLRTANGGEVKVATRQPGGEWTEAVTVSTPDTKAAYPAVAISPDNTVVVAWIEIPRQGQGVAAVRSLSPNGELSPLVTLGSASAQEQPVDSVGKASFVPLDVAAGGDDRVAVAWIGAATPGNPYETPLQVAFADAGAAFGEPITVSEPGFGADTPSVLVGSDNRISVAWTQQIASITSGSGQQIAGSSSDTAGKFAPATYLTDGASVSEMSHVSDVGAGKIGFAWTDGWLDGKGTPETLYFAEGPSMSQLSSPAALFTTPAGGAISRPHLASNSKGVAATSWEFTDQSPSEEGVYTAVKRDGSWSPATPLRIAEPPAGVPGSSSVAVDQDGRITALWTTDGALEWVTQACQ